VNTNPRARPWQDRLALPWWLIPALTLTGAVVAPLALALGLLEFRSDLPGATVALALAAVVSLLATTGSRLCAAVAAVTAAIGFDVWFTRPYGSLSISTSQDIETTGLLLVVGIIVGQLAARNRSHARQAREISADLRLLHAVAEMLADGSPTSAVVSAVAADLVDILRLRACSFEHSFAEPPGPFIERYGAVSWGALRWGFRTMGLPNKEVTLVVQHRGHPLGRFVLLAQPGTRVTTDQLIAAVALADQAGVAIAQDGGTA